MTVGRRTARFASWAAMLGAATLATPTLVACPSPAVRWGIEDVLVVRVEPGESAHVSMELNEWATFQAQDLLLDIRDSRGRSPFEVVMDDAALDADAYSAAGVFAFGGQIEGRCTPGTPCRFGLTILLPDTWEAPAELRVFGAANRPYEGCGYQARPGDFDPRAELVVVAD